MEASQASSVARGLELGSHSENGYSIHPLVPHSIITQHFAWHRGYRVAWGISWPPAAPAIGHKETVSPPLVAEVKSQLLGRAQERGLSQDAPKTN